MAWPNCKSFVGIGNWAVFLFMLSQQLEGLFASNETLSTNDSVLALGSVLESPQREGYDANGRLAQTVDAHVGLPEANVREAQTLPLDLRGVVAEEADLHKGLDENMVELAPESKTVVSPRAAARYVALAAVAVFCLAIMAKHFRERRKMAEQAMNIAKLNELRFDGEKLAQSIGTAEATRLWMAVSENITMAENAQLAMEQERRNSKIPLVTRGSAIQKLEEDVQTGVRNAVAGLRLLHRCAYDRVGELVQGITTIGDISSYCDHAVGTLSNLVTADYAEAWVKHITTLDNEVGYAVASSQMAATRFTNEPQFAGLADGDLLVSAREHLDYVKSLKEVRDSAADAVNDLKVSTVGVVKKLTLADMQGRLKFFLLAQTRLEALFDATKARIPSENTKSIPMLKKEIADARDEHNSVVQLMSALHGAYSIGAVDAIRADAVKRCAKLDSLLVECEKHLAALADPGEQGVFRDVMSQIASSGTQQTELFSSETKAILGSMQAPDAQQLPEFQLPVVLERLVDGVKQAVDKAEIAVATCKDSSKEINKGTVGQAFKISSKVITQGSVAAEAHYDADKRYAEYLLLKDLRTHMAGSAARLKKIRVYKLYHLGAEAEFIREKRDDMKAEKSFIAEEGKLSKIAEAAARMRKLVTSAETKYYQGLSEIEIRGRQPGRWTVDTAGLRDGS